MQCFPLLFFYCISVKLQTCSRGVCCKLLAQNCCSIGALGSVTKLDFWLAFSCPLPHSLHRFWMVRQLLRLSNHTKKANKSDLKQQTQCSDGSTLSRTPSTLSGCSPTSPTAPETGQRLNGFLTSNCSRGSYRTLQETSRQELCCSAYLLLGRPRAVMDRDL